MTDVHPNTVAKLENALRGLLTRMTRLEAELESLRQTSIPNEPIEFSRQPSSVPVPKVSKALDKLYDPDGFQDMKKKEQRHSAPINDTSRSGSLPFGEQGDLFE